MNTSPRAAGFLPTASINEEKMFPIPIPDEIERQVLNSIRHDFNETYKNWFKILIDDSSKDSQLDEDFTPI